MTYIALLSLIFPWLRSSSSTGSLYSSMWDLRRLSCSSIPVPSISSSLSCRHLVTREQRSEALSHLIAFLKQVEMNGRYIHLGLLGSGYVWISCAIQNQCFLCPFDTPQQLLAMLHKSSASSWMLCIRFFVSIIGQWKHWKSGKSSSLPSADHCWQN